MHGWVVCREGGGRERVLKLYYLSFALHSLRKDLLSFYFQYTCGGVKRKKKGKKEMHICLLPLNITIFRSFHMKEQVPSIPYFLELEVKPVQKDLFFFFFLE